MGEPVEQRGGHFGVTEHGRPLAEGQVGGDQDRGLFVKLADEMEEQLAAGLGKWQIAKLIEDGEVEAAELIGDTSLAPDSGLGFEAVDEIDDIVEAATLSGAHAVAADGNRQMGITGSGSADEDGVALLGDEAALGKIAHQALVDRQAADWVKAHWRYRPALAGTKPVVATTSAVVIFEQPKRDSIVPKAKSPYETPNRT